MEEILNTYFRFLNSFFETAWIWLPFFLMAVFFKSWMYYIQRFYWHKLDWILLEVRPPKDIEKTPKNMEQIFAGLWSTVDTVSTKYQKYILGMLQDYFSFEIVGANGEIHFYLRTLTKYRNLLESQIYAQYPQAEIKEVPDYISGIPANIPNKKWDLWGFRYKLEKKFVYPIRTYQHLIDLTKSDQPFLDPLASLMESLGRLRHGEQVWIQLAFRVVKDDWRDEARKVVDKLIGKKVTLKEGIVKTDIRTWGEAIVGVGHELITNKEYISPKKVKDEGPPSLAMHLSPGEKEIITGIEEKSSKKGFETKLQWAYIAPRSIFSTSMISTITSTFMQFANLNMNSLRPDAKLITKAYYGFAKMRKAYKQRVLMRILRSRSFWEKGFILNIEELASLYHFPTIGVLGPLTPYVPAKKGSPPINLPME